jgi:hypothetical protein
MTTTISDTFRSPAGTGVGGVVVRATLVAASEVLTSGGAIIREVETTTASDGTWSLALTPISSLAVDAGAYYLVTADGHRWTIDVPDTGTHTLNDVQIEPAPLPSTGATTVALAVRPTVKLWDGVSAYATVNDAVIYIGGPTDPTVNNGDMWIDTNAHLGRVRIGGASVAFS